jgi:uncharacterized Fe-S radical SAM superfamily protein PflX
MSGPRGRNDTGGSDESSEESDDGANVAVLLKHLTSCHVCSRHCNVARTLHPCED